MQLSLRKAINGKMIVSKNIGMTPIEVERGFFGRGNILVAEGEVHLQGKRANIAPTTSNHWIMRIATIAVLIWVASFTIPPYLSEVTSTAMIWAAVICLPIAIVLILDIFISFFVLPFIITYTEVLSASNIRETSRLGRQIFLKIEEQDGKMKRYQFYPRTEKEAEQFERMLVSH